MRGFKDGYGFVGLIVIFLCGLLTLDLGAPIEAAAYKIKIAAPLNDSVVSGTVPISLLMKSSTSFANVYVDGVYLASTPSAISWSTADVANGMHTISAKAYDSANQVIGTSSRLVRVKNKATPTPTSTPSPTGQVTISSPANGATVSGTVSIAVQYAAPVSWLNFYVRRKLGRIVAALHIGLEFKQRRERPALNLGEWIQHEQRLDRDHLYKSKRQKRIVAHSSSISNSNGSAYSSAHLDRRANSYARRRSEYYVAEVGRDCFRHSVCRRAERRASQLGQFLH